MRRSASERGYDARWRKLSRAYLARHPHCAICARAGRLVPATVVDHIIPHKGNDWLRLDPVNFQPLCTNCHSSAKQRGERSGRPAYSRAVDASGWPTDPLHPANRAKSKKSWP
jgi:5-methylcytosine-specific restriction enzyme A